MKLTPNLNKLRFKKSHKISDRFLFYIEKKAFYLLYGQYGLQSLESGKLTYRQIEACRRTVRRGISKMGRLWIRTFTYVSVTKKSIASRMGKGKGAISYWMSPIKRGQILFEIDCKSFSKALLVLGKASTKLPLKTKIIKFKF